MDTWHSTFRMDLPNANQMVMPGDQANGRFTLIQAMPVIEGQKFTLRENQSTVATGVVTKVLPEVFIKDKTRLDQVVVDMAVRGHADSAKHEGIRGIIRRLTDAEQRDIDER